MKKSSLKAKDIQVVSVNVREKSMKMNKTSCTLPGVGMAKFGCG
jgi:hypothetical protein